MFAAALCAALVIGCGRRLRGADHVRAGSA